MKVDTTKPSLQKDVYYATLLDWATRDSKWLLNRSFCPGGWAVDFCYLYIMYRALNACRPTMLVEFGLGQTTRMLAQYAKRGHGKEVSLTTVEHDKNWGNFYNSQLDNDIPKFSNETFELLKNQTYLIGGAKAEGVNMYAEPYYQYMNTVVNNLGRAQFVSIDAPFGTVPFSRIHLLDFVKYDWLDTNHFVIMVDDMEREGEKNTVNAFINILKKKNIKHHTKIYSGEKPHIIIVSDDLRFLCTM